MGEKYLIITSYIRIVIHVFCGFLYVIWLCNSLVYRFLFFLCFLISLSRAIIPTIQGYEDAGYFSVIERLKASLRENFFFHLVMGTVSLIGLILLIIMHRTWLCFLPPLKVIFIPLFLVAFGLCCYDILEQVHVVIEVLS